MSSSRHNMRMTPLSPKIDWQTKAVTAKDPHEFAMELQRSLQELTDAGYKIINQMARGDSIIITGQKLDMGHLHAAKQPQPAEISTMPPPGSRRRIVASALPQEKVTEEVLYHYREFGIQKQQTFLTLVEALRAVKAHLLGVADIVPISITCIMLTTFDPEAWPGLFKAFEDAMIETPNKPLG